MPVLNGHTAAVFVNLRKKASKEELLARLAGFKGAVRRFEKLAEVNGITFVDDYAHHPTEIKATLKTAKNYPHRELWVAFQPHTYSRTKAFLPEFADALSKGAEMAYKAVMKPAEGTILTVSRVSAETAVEA